MCAVLDLWGSLAQAVLLLLHGHAVAWSSDVGFVASLATDKKLVPYLVQVSWPNFDGSCNKVQTSLGATMKMIVPMPRNLVLGRRKPWKLTKERVPESISVLGGSFVRFSIKLQVKMMSLPWNGCCQWALCRSQTFVPLVNAKKSKVLANRLGRIALPGGSGGVRSGVVRRGCRFWLIVPSLVFESNQRHWFSWFFTMPRRAWPRLWPEMI